MPKNSGQMVNAIRDALGAAADKAIEDGQNAMDKAQPGPLAQTATPTPEPTQTPTPEPTPEPTAEASEPEIDEEGFADVEYVNDLPKVLGIEPAEFYKMKIRLAEDGEPVPIGQIKDAAQQIQRERAALATERQRLEQEAAAMTAQMSQAGQQQTFVTKEMEDARAELDSFRRAYPTLEQGWAQREKDDPGKVALERQKVAEAARAAERKYQHHAYLAGQMQVQAQNQNLLNENAILANTIPGWADPAIQPKLKEGIAQFAMHKYGARPEDLAHVDARTVKMLYDGLKAEVAAHQAKQAAGNARGAGPRVPKGTRVPAGAARKTRTKDLENRARSTRSRADVTSAVRGILSEVVNSKGRK